MINDIKLYYRKLYRKVYSMKTENIINLILNTNWNHPDLGGHYRYWNLIMGFIELEGTCTHLYCDLWDNTAQNAVHVCK